MSTPHRGHRATADDCASDALQFLGSVKSSSDPQTEIMAGIGYALLALDNRVRELLILLDDRL